jgi:hypothetical protein
LFWNIEIEMAIATRIKKTTAKAVIVSDINPTFRLIDINTLDNQSVESDNYYIA